jgi:acetaldehyde dehydrogenase/alcohol dehydrogenase
MATKKIPEDAKTTEKPVRDIPREIDELVSRTKTAQEKYATYCQEKVDEIFFQVAMAANKARIPLAKAASDETGMGIVEDKVIKNHFASEFIYNKYRNHKTCGIVEKDETNGFFRVAEPLGVLAGIIPTTNPTSTAIFKALLALKTRNGIVFSPHPRAKKCTVMTAKLIHDAAVKAGAPEGIVACIEEPSVEGSQYLMSHRSISMTLATGGPGMVKAAYSSGRPAIGVGSGNTPAVIDETADIKMAVNSILLSKTFDNGLICASEQSVIVCEAVYDKVYREFTERGAIILNDDQREKLRRTIIQDGKLNVKIVGQPAHRIAELSGFKVPESTKVLIGEAEKIGSDEPLSYEKLSPVLGLYRAKDFSDAVEKASRLVIFAGMGHTSVLYTQPSNRDRIKTYSEKMSTGRVLINMPSSQGAIGDVYNFRLEPSLTLGCGSWGGNSVSENVGIRHLINLKTVAERRENMLWFRVPSQVYFKPGCLSESLNELEGRKKAFLVTDRPLYDLGYSDKVTKHLESMGMEIEIFADVKPDPDISTIQKGLERLKDFNPDVVLALGGGSPIDAAKIMWLLYEHPEVRFDRLSMRFMDIRKRVCKFPKMGKKAIMVAIPTTSGTGSEVTPFAVITDDKEGVKYPIADYELTPDMAIVDPDLVLSMPRGVAAASGIDAVTHALEALVATTATDYTNGIAMEALKLLFTYLPASYRDGAANPEAREKVHYAATMAGMAFANAFLGLCHSMSHKLGSAFHVAHGVANGILITEVIRYNMTSAPRKQAAFPQYKYPEAKERYAKVADYLGLSGKSYDDKIEALISAIEKLRKDLDLPSTIEEAGVNEADFMAKVDELSELAFDDQCTGNNPRYPLISEIRELYLKGFKKR